MRVILLTVSVMLIGCNSDSIDVAVMGEVQKVRSDFTPIGNLYETPYRSVAVDAPVYLTPIYNGMTANAIYQDNATVFFDITDSKPLGEYEIGLDISYRYMVRMNIRLENEMCASVWFWNNKPMQWSEVNSDCLLNYRLYTAEEAMNAYGWMEVEKGNNFETLFPRIEPVSLEWLVK